MSLPACFYGVDHNIKDYSILVTVFLKVKKRCEISTFPNKFWLKDKHKHGIINLEKTVITDTATRTKPVFFSSHKQMTLLNQGYAKQLIVLYFPICNMNLSQSYNDSSNDL